MTDLPLVSVCVITYNSSEFVIEALNSVYCQNYPNIELIVSDDCSTDDTVEKIQEWLSVFGHKFTKAVFLTAEKNSGITANCSRALAQAHGEWVKLVDGDDFIYPNAIDSLVSFVQARQTEDISLVASSIQIFKDHPGNLLYTWPNFKISDNIREQLRGQIIGGYIKSMSVFMKREAFLKVGGFNPNYPMLEDDPLWVRFLTNGYKFHFHNEVLAGYRVHSKSISNGSFIPKKEFFPSIYTFKKDVAFPLLKKEGLYFNFIAQKMEYNVYARVLNSGKIRPWDKLLLKVCYRLNKFFSNNLNKK